MSKSNLGKLILLAVVIVGAILFAQSLRGPKPVEDGQSAPDFSLPALNSGTVSLAKYRGQVILVNFWATWCPPCVEETPGLVKFAEEMRPQGVTVIGVSVDEDSGALDKFVKEHNIPYPIARDADKVIASRYGTFKFPETYIIDRDGRVAEKIIGAIDWTDPRIATFVQNLAQPPKKSEL
jgi:cytochrome c biogenesis protein CcmG, thiol:disulfide interchange protein DsbE